MGNSEVGHMNIGAGRVVMQDLPRIDQAIADGSLAADRSLARLHRQDESERRRRPPHGPDVARRRALAPGPHRGARGHPVAGAGLPVWIHAFLDGRDTPPKSAAGYLATFIADTAPLGRVSIATVSGRYYAMDRDKRWERVALAYDALVDARGERAADALAAVEQSYAQERRPTSSSCRPSIGGFAGMQGRRRRRDGQFPRRPRARDPAGAARSGVRRLCAHPRRQASPQRSAWSSTRTQLNRFMTALFPPEELTERAGRDRGRRAASSSCASPRPRNTRTSPSSSTAATSASCRARSASWCPRPRSRPTT